MMHRRYSATQHSESQHVFTGLVEEIGTLRSIDLTDKGGRLSIAASAILSDAERGASIAVDGCCLTIETFTQDLFTVFASAETLRVTTLGDRRVGDGVNLERALTLQKRLGGHLVSGHVDAKGRFRSATRNGDAFEVWVDAPPEVISFCVQKGSITVDGISLTLVDVRDDSFSLYIIPETWERTTLHARRPGERVNLESDIVAKYVFRCVQSMQGAPASARDAQLRGLLEKGSWGSR